jgi:hypothetical protein
MKTFVTVIAILLIASVASANVLIESGVRPQRRAAACTHLSESGLPEHHDYAEGYSEVWLDDNTVAMYFTQPEVETDIQRAFRAKTEGWIWGGYGFCECIRKTEVGSPELRLNKRPDYDQTNCLKYAVGTPALKWNIVSATLNAKYCYGYSGDLEVEVWAGDLEYSGVGTDYRHGCCSPYNYCTPTGSFSISEEMYCATTSVYTQCQWYDWDITDCAKAYQAQAPTQVWLFMFGSSGSGYYQRWCSTCNNPPGEEKCGPYVQIVAQPK